VFPLLRLIMENTEELLMEMINRCKAGIEEIEKTFGEYGKDNSYEKVMLFW